MKKLLMVAALGAAGLLSTGVQAQSPATGNFNVVINLTPGCQIAVIPDITLNYTSFDPATTASTTANVSCTSGLPYSLSLDTLAVLDDAVNLNYTMNIPGGTGPFNGTGAAVGHQIDATILANQAGTCANPAGCSNAAATNRQRTLTVSW